MTVFAYTQQRTIVALDTTDLNEFMRLVEIFRGKVWGFKIGLEAIVAHGLEKLMFLIRSQSLDVHVFVDMKFHDIPNTVAGASRAAAQNNIHMFNIHLSAGISAIRAAAKAKAVVNPNAILLGVTILTSLSDRECRLSYGANRARKVMQFACWMSRYGGQDPVGIVCSGKEAKMIKTDPRTRRLKLVVPGIRLAGDSKNDQAVVLTPGGALAAGADYEVIGRSLTGAPDPLDALRRANESYEEAAAKLG
jgi:orotidine-5'-phosphate decarboxylase